MDTLWKFLATCHENSFYPEVIAFALGFYFTVRWWFDVGPKRSQWAPVAAAFVGMVYFIRPLNADLAIKFFFLAALHAFVAVGGYSWADKRGWIDKIGDIVDQKLFGNKKSPTDEGRGTTDETKPPAPGAPGFARIDALMLIVAVALFTSLFIGCGTASVIKKVDQLPHSIETTTVQGAPVEEVQPTPTMDRKDVPVGVDPDKVLKISDKEGDAIYVKKTGFLGMGPLKVYKKDAAATPIEKMKGTEPSAPAPVNDLKVETAKPSHALYWWLAGITAFFALLILGNKALTGFFGFNPIALIGGFLAGLLAKLKPQAKAETSKVLADISGEAGETSAHALQGVKSWRQRVCEKVKNFIARKTGI